MSVRETLCATMPQAAVKFVDGVCERVKSVHNIILGRRTYGDFPLIANVFDAVGLRRVGGLHETVVLPLEPFQSFDGLVSSSAVPSQGRYNGDGLSG